MLLCYFCITSQAETVLIDGTSPGYILNGSFEVTTGFPTSTPVLNNWVSLDETTATTDIAAAKVDSQSTDGPNSGFLGYASGGSGYSLAIDTYATDNYLIGLGDIYTLSFDHIGLAGWVDNDEYLYTLFYTNSNDLTGVSYDGTDGILDNITALATGAISVQTSYNTAMITTSAVTDPNAVGKHLWLGFTLAAGEDKYARVDQVNLTVIPEPSSFLLMIAAGMGLLLATRFKRRR